MTQQPTRLQRILGGGEENAALKSARGTMIAFERVWGGTRLLAPDHPAREQQLELFVEAVVEHVKTHGELRLDVGAFAFTIDGIEILKIDRARENYIYRLYQDGVRRVTFTEDLTPGELDRLMNVLRTNFTDASFVEDDLVTLLWDAQIEGFDYRAVESINDTDDEKRRADLPTIDELLAMATETDLPLRELPAGEDDRTLAQRALQLPDTVQPSVAGDDAAFGLAEDARAALRERIGAPDPVLGAKLGAIAFRTLAALGPPAQNHTAAAFGDLAEDWVASRDVEPLVQALGAVQVLAKNVPDGRGDAIASALFRSLERAPTIRGLLEWLELDDAGELPVKLLRAVAASGFTTVWEQIFAHVETGRRRMLLPLLEPCAPAFADFLAERACTAGDEEAVAALAQLRKLDVMPVSTTLARALDHPAAQVRSDAAMTLRNVDAPEIRRRLIEQTADGDPSVRMQLYPILAQLPGADGERALLGVLRAPDFGDRDPDEQVRVVACLGRAAGDSGIEALRDVASSNGELRVASEAQVAAIRLLAQRRDAASLPGLRKLSGKLLTNREVKAAARDAVTAIADAREQEQT